MRVPFSTTAGRAAEMCGGKITVGSPDAPIHTVTSDSREMGEGNLFIALIGEKHDGHEFIEKLCREKMISSILTMKIGCEDAARENGVTVILCDDTLRGLGAMASRRRSEMNPYVIGITGTNGKTTTKEIVYTIISSVKRTLRNEKNFNNEIGVPFTLLGLTPEHEMAVVEMGMNHEGEIDRLSAIVRPDMAVITNVGEGHLEFLGSIENVARAKSEIMNGMAPGSLVIINRDTECFDILAATAKKKGLKLMTFGLQGNADVSPDLYNLSDDSISLVYRGTVINAPLFGIHNVYNLLAAVVVSEACGISVDRIAGALTGFVNVDGRSSVIDRGFIIINDTYNSNPLSSRYAIRSAAVMYPGRRKIAVLSDMKELGSTAERYHREIGAEAAKNGFSLLCVWGEMAGAYAEGALAGGMKVDSIHVFVNKTSLADFLARTLTENDVVLVKGSRSMKMEEIVTSLAGKGVA